MVGLGVEQHPVTSSELEEEHAVLVEHDEPEGVAVERAGGVEVVDLDVTMRVLTRLATEQGVAIHLPTVHRREDPWAGLRSAP